VVTLNDLRLRHRTYNPPQSWHFMDECQLQRLIGGHVAHRDLKTMIESQRQSRSHC
jgi:hypothetical protein